MRIAYLTGRYPAISHTFVLREVRALRELGVEIDTFSIWRSGADQLLSPTDVAENERTYAFLPASARDYARAHLLALAESPEGYFRHLVDALRLGTAGLRGKGLGLSWFSESIVLWQRCRERDIRHTHVHLNGTAPSVALLAARFGNRVRDRGRESARPWTWSLTVHGPAEFYDVARERLPEKVTEASFVISISDFARSQLMVHVEEAEWSKIEVVHCGVRPADFPALQRSREDGEINLLSVGRLAPMKGQALLVEAVAELARRGVPARLTVVGEGPKREVIERLVEDLGVADRVVLAGAVGQDAIPGYYAEADVFCLSSFAEGVPVVLMEAMASSLPVVAPRLMGIGELVDDGVSGLLVRPGRADELAAALETLTRDPDLRRRMGDAGRRKVAEEFDLDRSARQLRDIFAARIPAAP